MTPTWADVLTTLNAAADCGYLPRATFHRPDTILAVVEISCDSVPDGDAWAGWVETDPQPFTGHDAVCWLGKRPGWPGWVVVVSAPLRVAVAA